MEEYEVEVFLSGRMICSIIATDRAAAEESAHNKTKSILSSCPPGFLYIGNVTLFPMTDYYLYEEDDKQMEEEDQWNGPKR